MISFIGKHIDLVGTGAAVTLAGISLADINMLAQALAAMSAAVVAWVTIYYRVKDRDKKDKDE